MWFEPTPVVETSFHYGAGIFPVCPVGSPKATPSGFFGSFCLAKRGDNFKFFFDGKFLQPY